MLEVYFLEIEKHWNWHWMLIELIEHLQQNYEVKLFHKKGASGERIVIEKFNNYLIPDCEMLIYDTEKDQLTGIMFSEWRTGMVDIFMERDNPNDVLLLTHLHGTFQPTVNPLHLIKFQLKSTVYYPYIPYINYDYFYTLRKFRGYDNLIDKMFCLFTTNRHDPHPMREMGLVSTSPGLLSMQDYCLEGIKYKVGLSIHGLAEICHRDIEYMAIGLPMLRLEYMNNLNPKLIPNYHYISIPRGNEFPMDGHADRIGGEKYIEAYKNRFYEVKDDLEFLEFISKNAREYYVNYCSPQNRMQHLLSLINLDR